MRVHPDHVLAKFDGTALTPATVEVKTPTESPYGQPPAQPTGMTAVGYRADGVFVGRVTGTRDLILIETPNGRRLEHRPGPLPLILPPLNPDRHLTEVLLHLPVHREVRIVPALAGITASSAGITSQLRVVWVTLLGDGTTVRVTYVPDRALAVSAFERLLPRPEETARRVLRVCDRVVWPRLVDLVTSSARRALESRLGRDVVTSLTPYLNLLFTALRAALDRLWEFRLSPTARALVEEGVRLLNDGLKWAFTLLYPERIDPDALARRERVRAGGPYGFLSDWLSTELRSLLRAALLAAVSSVERFLGTSLPREDVKWLLESLYRPLEALLRLALLNLLAGTG
ncbi:MAG: hypothetical protein ABGY09_08125 [Euryarchaeota archaeon]